MGNNNNTLISCLSLTYTPLISTMSPLLLSPLKRCRRLRRRLLLSNPFFLHYHPHHLHLHLHCLPHRHPHPHHYSFPKAIIIFNADSFTGLSPLSVYSSLSFFTGLLLPIIIINLIFSFTFNSLS